ncbi:hypothetical protein RB195_013859 [Necator americanus]|uniref:Aminotransferase class I/classII large domain-containing protein n=1 Tax=Necator americanus TaxID=51031 RepID=A0ABR1DYN8_NECAM
MMSYRTYFSESCSNSGDWTKSDCVSLDEFCYPLPADPHQLSGTDVLLLSSFPAAAVRLAKSLVYRKEELYDDDDGGGEMPRRIREQILEVTKTVTVTEIVNSAPDKHPRSCEVTVTNLASDTSHPVSVKISHLHERQSIDHNEAGTQTPTVTVEEHTWDAVDTAPDGTTRIEQEKRSKVERIRRRNMPVTTTFNLPTDNVIDLQFTQPVLIEKHDQRQPKAHTFETFASGPVHTLYYRNFSDSDNPLDIVRPTYAQPDVLQRSSVVDETDLGSMASDGSSGGSIIIHADDSSPGRALSAEGYFTTPMKSSENSEPLEKANSDDGVPKRPERNLTNNRRSRYIVTSKEETKESDREPTIRWIYAEFDPSSKMKEGNARSAGAGGDEVKGETAKTSAKKEQLPCTSKSIPNGHAIFNKSSNATRSEHLMSVTSKPTAVASKRPQNACESTSFIANDALTGCGPSVRTDQEDVFERRRRSTPPLMTSTPYTTLERKDRSSVDIISDRNELRQSQSFPVIRLENGSDIGNKENDVGHDEVGGELVPASPRRVPSSPIVVLNQSRKSSLDQHFNSGERRRRKSTVTDIDWFAAFKMKEPSTPNSPGCAFVLDVMKQADAAGEHTHPLYETTRHHVTEAPKPVEIDMDEIFCVNSGSTDTKSCPCNACYLTKLSDDERTRFLRRSSRRRKVRPAEKTMSQPPTSSNNVPTMDISLDEVFEPHRASRSAASTNSEDERHASRSVENSGPLSPEDMKNAKKTTFCPEKTTSLSSQKEKTEINLDEIFPTTNSCDGNLREHKRKSETTQLSYEKAFAKEVEMSPELQQQQKPFNWVAALVGTNSSDFSANETKTGVVRAPRIECSDAHIDVDVNRNKPDDFSSVSTISSTEINGRSSPSNGLEGTEDWLHNIVKSEKSEEQKTSISDEEKPSDVSRKMTSAQQLSDDLMQTVFNREGTSSGCDGRKCRCAACTIDIRTAPTTNGSGHGEHTSGEVHRSKNKAATSIQKDPATCSKDNIEEKTSDSSSKVYGDPRDPPDSNESEAIHFPPGRTTLVGDVLRKPSILEETSFNTDHLSSISDVSKAYVHRLTQLKSELDLEEKDKNQGPSVSVPNLNPHDISEHGGNHMPRATFYSAEPDSLSEEALKREPISDEALIDAVFSAVFEGESSEMTSLGAASSSQNLLAPDRPSTDEDAEKNHDKSEPVELLNQSMDEAIFSASRSLRKHDDDTKEETLDTPEKSSDKDQQEQLDSAPVVDSKEGSGEQEKDAIMEAVFTSTIDNQQFMESVISYPGSASSSRITSSATTPGPNRSRKDSEVFFASNTGPAPEGDVTFVSNASVVMNNTHSSSEGEFDEDYIIKLVFSEKNEEAVPKDGAPIIETPRERVEKTVRPPPVEDPSESAIVSANSEIDNRSLSPMENDMDGKADEELLEVEVFPGYFHIKGNYSLVVAKGDPLGVLLADVHSKGSSSSLDFSITPKLRRMLIQCFKEKTRPNIEGADMICYRARNLLTEEDVSDIVYTMMEKNRFNAESNPEGNINFCTAENNLCTKEVMEQLKSKGFSPDESHLIHYPPAGGYISTKQAVAKYMAEFMSIEPPEQELVILPSSTSGYDMLCHCTCEAEDIVLTSVPTYAASVRNCGFRAECRIRPVEMDMESPRLDVDAYQKQLDYHNARGAIVGAVLIINPHNPLGIVFPPDDVLKLCNWATRNNLVVLVDESFSSCVFAPDSSFKSFLSYRNRLENPENVIYLWSLSKDFGVPGLKLSVVQSCCPKLIESLGTLERIHPVSAVAQDVAVAILTDFEWLRNFHDTKLKRLSAHYKYVADHLRQMALSFCPAVAGCFVMVDFRKHLRAQTFADELSLFQSLCDRGVMLTPGQHVLCQQPGWMRLVFSCDKKELIEGINRIRKFFNLEMDQNEADIEY